MTTPTIPFGNKVRMNYISRVRVEVSIVLILVQSLPSVYDTAGFPGAKALTSMSGKGAYLQHQEYLYELTCDVINCTWSIMTQKLAHPVKGAIMMYFPPELKNVMECQTCLVPPSLVGNGYCNDEANIEECGFDGGDCCGSCINSDYCVDCACLGNVTGNEFSNALIGDGFCNDNTNNVRCKFDGFDCCKGNITADLCTECACHGDSSIS